MCVVVAMCGLLRGRINCWLMTVLWQWCNPWRRHITTAMLPQESPSAISKAALSGDDDKASEAVDMFLSIIGAEAGHMGLRLLAKGGVCICGGITPKVRPLLPERGTLAWQLSQSFGRSTYTQTRWTLLLWGRTSTVHSAVSLHHAWGPQLLGRIMEGGVLEAFLDRGARFAPVLRDIPLIVVTNDMLGLLGARQYALKLLDENITEVTHG